MLRSFLTDFLGRIQQTKKLRVKITGAPIILIIWSGLLLPFQNCRGRGGEGGGNGI